MTSQYHVTLPARYQRRSETEKALFRAHLDDDTITAGQVSYSTFVRHGGRCAQLTTSAISRLGIWAAGKPFVGTLACFVRGAGDELLLANGKIAISSCLTGCDYMNDVAGCLTAAPSQAAPSLCCRPSHSWLKSCKLC